MRVFPTLLLPAVALVLATSTIHRLRIGQGEAAKI